MISNGDDGGVDGGGTCIHRVHLPSNPRQLRYTGTVPTNASLNWTI